MCPGFGFPYRDQFDFIFCRIFDFLFTIVSISFGFFDGGCRRGNRVFPGLYRDISFGHRWWLGLSLDGPVAEAAAPVIYNLNGPFVPYLAEIALGGPDTPARTTDIEMQLSDRLTILEPPVCDACTGAIQDLGEEEDDFAVGIPAGQLIHRLTVGHAGRKHGPSYAAIGAGFQRVFTQVGLTLGRCIMYQPGETQDRENELPTSTNSHHPTVDLPLA